MFTKLFWKDVGERLIATLAQVAIGVIVAGGIGAIGTQVGIVTVATAGVLVVLKALTAGYFADDTVSPASLATEK